MTSSKLAYSIRIELKIPKKRIYFYSMTLKLKVFGDTNIDHLTSLAKRYRYRERENRNIVYELGIKSLNYFRKKLKMRIISAYKIFQ